MWHYYNCLWALNGHVSTRKLPVLGTGYKPPLSHSQASSTVWPEAACLPRVHRLFTTYAMHSDTDQLFDQDGWDRFDLATVPSLLTYAFD